jgi:hypothetical protein
MAAKNHVKIIFVLGSRINLQIVFFSSEPHLGYAPSGHLFSQGIDDIKLLYVKKVGWLTPLLFTHEMS